MLHLMLNINTQTNIKIILLSTLFKEISNWFLRAYKNTNNLPLTIKTNYTCISIPYSQDVSQTPSMTGA